jgi:hypothetical protein
MPFVSTTLGTAWVCGCAPDTWSDAWFAHGRYYDQSLKPESAQLVQSKVPNKHAMKAIGYGKVGRPITTREKYAEMHRVSRHSHWYVS